MDAIKKALGLDVPTTTRGLTLAALGLLALAFIAIPLLGPSMLCIVISVVAMLTIFAGMGIYVSRMQAGALRGMLAGDYWAHWTYSFEEAQQFHQHEATRTGRDMRATFFLGIVLGVVVGVVMGLLTRSLVYGLLAGGFTFLLGLTLVMQDASKGKAYVFPGAGGQEVYIGQAGVYEPGRFCSFAYLRGVELESGDAPRTILFYIVTSSYNSQINGYDHRTGRPDQVKPVYNTDPVRVGVPIGHEAEAEQLVARFKAQLGKTSQATS